MPLSKVKSAKQRARLKARRDAFEAIPPSKRVSPKTGRPIYTKPGSNKK